MLSSDYPSELRRAIVDLIKLKNMNYIANRTLKVTGELKKDFPGLLEVTDEYELNAHLIGRGLDTALEKLESLCSTLNVPFEDVLLVVERTYNLSIQANKSGKPPEPPKPS